MHLFDHKIAPAIFLVIFTVSLLCHNTFSSHCHLFEFAIGATYFVFFFFACTLLLILNKPNRFRLNATQSYEKSKFFRKFYKNCYKTWMFLDFRYSFYRQCTLYKTSKAKFIGIYWQLLSRIFKYFLHYSCIMKTRC